MASTQLHPQVWRASELAASVQSTTPTGWTALDAQLPGGGWPLGAVVELQAAVPPWRLLLPALQQACRHGQVALVALPLVPNAAAWAAHGLPLSRLWCVHPCDAREALWCAEQLLTCPEVALCWLHVEEPPPLAWTQRLQQAAAAARCAGARGDGADWPAPLVVLSRPDDSARPDGASAAPLRLRVRVEGPATLVVQVRKRRGPPLARALRLHAPWLWSEWIEP
ncbi:hypothetical protein [Tepidimonas alkaliphilus]|uniref:hypothetical protein n=1 Tax=Tepidimonas alkaliphilus TaxID=2588942 RepID=UPI00163DA1E7|nr:hypothetical protein [Tepidimonas alkaliphilus]